jgi:dienelactone hydrolase
MRFPRRIRIAVMSTLILLCLCVLVILTPAQPTPAGAISRGLYETGTASIGRLALTLTDSSRATPANADFPGQPFRDLSGMLWYPREPSGGPYPLLVYSHGFMSSVNEADYLVEFLVPKGYIIAAVNYPLSTGSAPGGPTVNDVLSQPGDISFLIDELLNLNTDTDSPVHGRIDSNRIAAIGLSLGGLTTQLAGFHRDTLEPRLSAAVSIAGPSQFLEPAFFKTRDLPFMMIAGSEDAIIPYPEHAAPIPDKVRNSILVSLDSGTHVGFAGSVATRFMRWFNHPDKLVCPMLLRGLENGNADSPPMLAPDAEIGISSAMTTPCTMTTFPRAMRPAQQQMLTRLAIYAFLEKQFAQDPARQTQMRDYLSNHFVTENPGVRISAGH